MLNPTIQPYAPKTRKQQQSLNQTLRYIQRTLGDRNALRYGNDPILQPSWISTGLPELDAMLGGGFPEGRIIEIFGPEGCGKTSLALHHIAQVQRRGGTAALIDLEHAFTPNFAAILGVQLEPLLMVEPKSGEDAIAILIQLVASKAVDLIVLDSTAAFCTSIEQKSDLGEEPTYHNTAWLLSKAMRCLMHVIHPHCSIIFIHQLRYKNGITYGNPEKCTGGDTVRNYCSLSLETRRILTLGKLGGKLDQATGIKLLIKSKKNKFAPPYKTVELDLYFDRGLMVPPKLMDNDNDFDPATVIRLIRTETPNTYIGKTTSAIVSR
jgi:recombination protein RecA